MTARLRFLLFGLLLASSGWAQTTTAASSTSLAGQIYSEMNDLTTTGSGVLVGMAQNAVAAYTGLIFTLLLIRWAFMHLGHHHFHLNVWPFLSFMFLVAGIQTMLTYYVNPIPGFGFGISQLPIQVFKQVAATIDLSRVSLVETTMTQWFGNVQQPTGPLNFIGYAVYGIGWLNVALLEIAMLLVTVYGVIFYGLTALVGPFFIFFLLIPPFRPFFHSWMATLMRYGFYPVPAAALLYIWADIWIRFLTNIGGTDYSLDHLSTMLLPMLGLNFAMYLTTLKITSWVGEVFGGHTTGGAGLIPDLARIGFMK